MSATCGWQSVGCTTVDETYGPQRGHDALRSTPTGEPGEHAVPVPVVLPTDDDGKLDRTFGRDEITVIRHEVQSRLVSVGFTGDRLQGFVLAVNEVITNVVLHAGGHGRIVLWLTGGSAWCTVTDSGPGIPKQYLSPPDVPEAFDVGGRGIWLAYALCDEVTMATGPIGTTIGLRMALPGTERASGLVNDAAAAG
jgi:anti-sigma regulatory factor (Ser/Thr protein kinase)